MHSAALRNLCQRRRARPPRVPFFASEDRACGDRTVLRRCPLGYGGCVWPDMWKGDVNAAENKETLKTLHGSGGKFTQQRVLSLERSRRCEKTRHVRTGRTVTKPPPPTFLSPFVSSFFSLSPPSRSNESRPTPRSQQPPPPVAHVLCRFSRSLDFQEEGGDSPDQGAPGFSEVLVGG